jgi:hypothetical protein
MKKTSVYKLVPVFSRLRKLISYTGQKVAVCPLCAKLEHPLTRPPPQRRNLVCIADQSPPTLLPCETGRHMAYFPSSGQGDTTDHK